MSTEPLTTRLRGRAVILRSAAEISTHQSGLVADANLLDEAARHLDLRPAPDSEERVLAALDVLGWPDDRTEPAHVEPDGFEVTGPGHYWELVVDVLNAAERASSVGEAS